MKRIIAMIMICALSLSVFSACGLPQAEDLMVGINPKGIAGDYIGVTDVSNVAVTDFAVRLFKASQDDGKNTLISPLSVLAALSMTANGADKDTLTQMQNVLGMPIDQLNAWINNYMTNLPEEEKYKLSLANSIWFTDDERFTVNQDFLQTNADYFGADIYRAPFDDTTCKEINKWVEDKTDGMIKNILDQIPAEAVMYLINALAFDAEWQDIYFESQVRKGEFTTENDDKRKIDMMYSEENKYLEDKKATGFIKYYKDRKYAFAALLPKEGVSVSEYISSLDGEHLNELLTNAKSAVVNTSIPKFESEYDVEMSEVLKGMGMPDAFSSAAADFSKLGHSTEGNIFISRVLHKTFISVDERGTKAGAATVVEMNDECAMLVEDPKQVYLDRPFVYMLIDCETNLPFFIGTMMDVES